MDIRSLRFECTCWSLRWVTVTLLSWTLALLGAAQIWAASIQVEAEVLEASDEIGLSGREGALVRYAVVHHARSQDQPVLAEWLRTHQSARVSFTTKGGDTYQGVLSRLKHCFGRGLLVYSGSVSLSEKDVIVLSLDSAR